MSARLLVTVLMLASCVHTVAPGAKTPPEIPLDVQAEWADPELHW